MVACADRRQGQNQKFSWFYNSSFAKNFPFWPCTRTQPYTQWSIHAVIHACENACSHPCMRKYMQPSTHVTMHASMHASTWMAVWMDEYMNQAIECHILRFGDQHAALAALNSLWGPRLGNKKFITNSRSIFLLPHNNVQIFPNK